MFSPNAAADFERCLALCTGDLQDDDLLSTVMSLYPYYTMRADIDRAQRLVESIRASLTGPRSPSYPSTTSRTGCSHGIAANSIMPRTKMELAAHTLTEEGRRALDAMLFMPNDPTAGLHTHLALARCIDGDLAGVEAEIGRAEEPLQRPAVPQGAIQPGLYPPDRGADPDRGRRTCDTRPRSPARLADIGERHGFDSWALVGQAQYATVGALIALAENDGDSSALAPHIAMLTSFVDTWRALGVIALITFYDAILARLLVAAGQPDEARNRLQTGLDLADQTGHAFLRCRVDQAGCADHR